MVDPEEIRKKIEIAKSAVEGLEEPMKTESYKVILDNLLKGTVQISSSDTKTQIAQNVIKESEEASSFDIDDMSTYGYIGDLSSGQDQSLALLDWAFKNSDKGLTPKEISGILKEKFGVSLLPNAINVALGSIAGRYVSRKKEGKTYRYIIIKQGQERLKKIEKNNSSDLGVDKDD